MPCRAARLIPPMIATGVARISGHGVATTSTASARTGSPESDPGGTADDESERGEPDRVAIGESLEGDLLACADRTSSTIRAYWLSPAGARTRAFRTPSRLRLPLKKREPGRAATGIGSPVSREVSTLELPSTTSRSQGISSPGRTRIRSPTFTASTATSLELSPLQPVRDPRRRRLQLPDRRGGAALGVSLERLASRLHQHDDEAGQRLAQEQRRRRWRRRRRDPRRNGPRRRRGRVLQTTGMPVMASPTVQSSRAGRGPAVYRRARPPTMQSRAPAGSAAAPRPISCCWRWLPTGRPGAG